VLLSQQGQAALPVFVHSAGFGEENTPADCWHGLPRAEVAVIQYTVGGCGRLRCRGRDLRFEPGQAMLLSGVPDHRCRIEEGERWEFVYVALGGRDALRAVREASDVLGPVFALDRDSTVLARLADACVAVLDERLDSAQASAELGYGIVMALLDACSADHELASVSSPPCPKFVSDVEQFCRSNFTRPIGVGDLARVAKLSRFHFTRQFEKVRGISPGRYLTSVRLEESLRLIARSNEPVRRIAESCGYEDANYFCKVFRRSFGTSPGALRSELRQARQA